MYSYAAIRDITNKHDIDLNDHLTEEQRRKEERNGLKFANFQRTTLILTDRAVAHTHIEHSVIKHEITADNILQFLKLNRNLFIENNNNLEFREEGIDMQPEECTELVIESRLRLLKENIDADIWEFDDKFEKSELVFAIIVNRTAKRITCVFRGSVWGNADWPTNLNIWKSNPEILKEFAGEKLGVHRGFANYLFNTNRADNTSKFEEIATIIDEIRAYKKGDTTPYKDFKIFVTGHSLGGALAQLLSCALAGSNRTANYPTPINAITFASPQVGDSAWLDAYKNLEKDGKLRHIRIFNKEDHVGVQPAIPFMGYTQTGVGINLRNNKEAIVEYRNARSAWSAFSATKPWEMHSLDVYHERLLIRQNREHLRQSIEELYEAHAGDYSN